MACGARHDEDADRLRNINVGPWGRPYGLLETLSHIKENNFTLKKEFQILQELSLRNDNKFKIVL